MNCFRGRASHAGLRISPLAAQYESPRRGSLLPIEHTPAGAGSTEGLPATTANLLRNRFSAENRHGWTRDALPGMGFEDGQTQSSPVDALLFHATNVQPDKSDALNTPNYSRERTRTGPGREARERSKTIRLGAKPCCRLQVNGDSTSNATPVKVYLSAGTNHFRVG